MFKAVAELPEDEGLRSGYAEEVEQLFAKLAADLDVVVRGTYDTAGMRADADLMIWAHGPSAEALQELYSSFRKTLLGQCWRPLANAIPGFAALKPWRAMLVGARDLDPAEKRLLEDQPVIRATCAEAAARSAKLVEAGGRRTHLHVDLDVIDPDDLQVNRYATAGGPSPT